MKKFVLSALAVASLAGSAFGQEFGTVQFRWRERALGVLPIVGGAQTTSLAAGATPATPNTGGTATNANDANFHLVLEAFVTQGTSGDNRGLSALPFSVIGNGGNRSQGNFVSAGGGAGNAAEFRNNALALNGTGLTTYTNQGITVPGNTLPGGPQNTDRGLFAPYRSIADLNGANQPAIGVQNLSTGGVTPVGNPAWVEKPTLENVLGLLNTTPFVQPAGPDDEPPAGPYNARYDLAGAGAWVPVYYAIYQLTSFDGRGADSVDLAIDVPTTWRGLINPANGSDQWALAVGQVPSFVIQIPAPGSAALLGLGGLLAARRRRQA